MEESDVLKDAKKNPKSENSTEQKLNWAEFRNYLNKDPWGLVYKIVMRKFGAQKPSPNLPRSVMENIIYTLFPEHEERHEIIEYENNDTQIFFTEQLVH